MCNMTVGCIRETTTEVLGVLKGILVVKEIGTEIENSRQNEAKNYLYKVVRVCG